MSILAPTDGNAQRGKDKNNYEKKWEEIERLTEERSYKSAYEAACKAYEQATEQKLSTERLIALWYECTSAMAYQEDATDSTIAKLEALLPELSGADQAVAHSLLAQAYDSRTLNYTLDEQQRQQKLADHRTAALADPDLLKRTSIEPYSHLCYNDRSTASFSITPTLYDMLVREEMRLAGDATKRHQWLQRLAEFHQRDNDDLRIFLDIEVLEAQNSIPNGTPASEADWLSLVEKYRRSRSKLVDRFYVHLAELCQKEKRFADALAYCNVLIKKYPKPAAKIFDLLEKENPHFSREECVTDYPELSQVVELHYRITLPHIDLANLGGELADRHTMTTASVRNLSHLYCRIVEAPEDGISYSDQYPLLRKKALHQWTLDVDIPNDYKDHDVYIYLPPMPAGHYALLVSPTEAFGKLGFEALYFDCSDVLFVAAESNERSLLSGYLLNAKTGHPLTNHTLTLEKEEDRKYSRHSTTTTDSNGYYNFAFDKTEQHRYYSFRLAVTYNGYTVHRDISLSRAARYTISQDDHYSLFTDRPIYKPGETVSFSLIAYSSNLWNNASVIEGRPLKVHLRDINYKIIATHPCATNASGMAYGEFKLPDGCMPGSYCIDIEHMGSRHLRKYVTVEAYKQPTFAITLQSDDNNHHFGATAHLSGDAVSYSQVPINDASVSYTIERERTNLWWWWRREEPTVVASGTTKTDERGHFAIEFTPEPDSSIQITDGTTYLYTLRATVTDLNGETHEQRLTLRIGFHSGYLHINNEGDQRELRNLDFSYLNLNGDPLQGTVKLRVERLRQPATALLNHPNHDYSVRHTISRADFEKRYPLMAYDSAAADPLTWEAEATVIETTATTSTMQGTTSIALPVLSDGIYRLTATTTTSTGEQISDTRIVNLITPAATRCNGVGLLWSQTASATALVGDTLQLRIGSRHNDVFVAIAITDGNGNVERRTLTLSNEIKTLSIPITEPMLGAMTINIIAAKEGVVEKLSHNVKVAYRHKELDLQLTTFRNKLQPGATEQWTLTITDRDGNPAQAAATMTMFDAALDNYQTLEWYLSPWRRGHSDSRLHYSRRSYSSYNFLHHAASISYYPLDPQQWTLLRLDNYRYQYYEIENLKKGRVMYSMAANREMDPMAAESDGAVYEEAVASIAEPNDETNATEDAVQPDTAPIEMRDNLNTLAFFEPCLTTAADGTATVTFTVPDLLTRWNIRAIAHTSDLKVGTLAAEAVTQKEIMAMPMVPRFLRQGDHVAMAVKVSNMSEQAQQVSVSLEMVNAETDRPWASPAPVSITVPSQGSSVATFEVDVPTDCYATIYRITARGSHHSDGEQGVIAVLSNRQMVTQSQAMYVNGRGEKSYALPSLTASATREPRLLAVEFTANPIWLAIQSLPYVSDRENPSNIYLFNQYYCNSVAQRIVDDNPMLQEVFTQWMADSTSQPQSRLTMNADLKQTIIEETPWLRDAEREEERTRNIGNYFEPSRIDKELELTLGKITKAQRPDGGWSWMPDGEMSSEYTTCYMLRLMGNLSQSERSSLMPTLRKAMEYIDLMADRSYQFILEHKIENAMDAEFLYIHSCFPEIAVSSAGKAAYKYYMDNARRLCLEQDGLYYRAELALIMQRAGERTLAAKLINQLRETSLTSDEMGLYWRDNVSGFLWNERPIEVQSMLIKAFSEIDPKDVTSVALMRQWLLKQKQTTSWNSDIASVAAIIALLEEGRPLQAGEPATITIGHHTIDNSTAQAGTGYVSHRWKAAEIKPDMTTVTINQKNESIGWGAAYWQYVDDIENIESSAMGITIRKSYLLIGADGKATEIRQGDAIKVGDRVRVQIHVQCDRHLEYVELKEARPAGMEPTNTSSGWRWNDGLSYYMAVTNTALHCYIDRLDKGQYVITYDLFATQAGNFGTGLSLMQSLYAPEFRAIGAGRRIIVERE